jgi:hypothetical protein
METAVPSFRLRLKARGGGGKRLPLAVMYLLFRRIGKRLCHMLEPNFRDSATCCEHHPVCLFNKKIVMVHNTKSREVWLPCCIFFLWASVSPLGASEAETYKRLGSGFSPHRIQMEGAQQVPADHLRVALAWDPVMMLTALPGAPMDEMLATVVSRITEGYLRAGFFYPNVEASAIEGGNNIMVSIDEGERVFIESLIVTGNVALASEVIMTSLTHPRAHAMADRKRPDSPLVEIGVPAPGDALFLKTIAKSVEEIYTEHGVWGIQAHASFSKPNSGYVALIVTIKDEGHRLEAEGVEVRGARINDADVIAGYSGITSGMPLTADTLSDVRQRLMRSGRFADCDVRIDHVVMPGEKATVVIEVTEIDGHPRLDESVPEMAALFQRTQNWLTEHLFRGEEEYLLQIIQSDLVVEVVVGSQGMAASVQAGDSMWSAFADGVDFGMITRRMGVTNAIRVRGAGVFFPFVSIDHDPSSETGKNWVFALGAGYNPNTQQSRADISLRIHPAAYLSVSLWPALSPTNAKLRLEDHGDWVAIEFSESNQWVRLDLERESGGLLAITNRQMDTGRIITMGRTHNRLAPTIEEMTSLLPDTDHAVDANAQNPLALIRFALKPIAHALVYSGRDFRFFLGNSKAWTELLCALVTDAWTGGEPSLSISEENTRLTALFENLIDLVIRSSTENDVSMDEPFVIPFDKNRDEQAARMAEAAEAMKSAMGLPGLVHMLFDWNTPPARLIRGITMAQSGFPQAGDRLIHDVLHDHAMGPVSWYFFGSGTSPEFAQLGLMSCRMATIEAELGWLIDPQSRFGNLALRTIQWLMTLNHEEWTLLAIRGGLSMQSAAAFSDIMSEMRNFYEASGPEIDWPSLLTSALQPWWESGGRKKVASVFISRGARVNERNIDTLFTLLHTLAGKGDAEGVELLLDSGARVNSFGQRMLTPLHFAAASGHADVARLLLQRGADVNAQADDGATALHFALVNDVTASNRRGLIEVLMLNGANPSIRTNGKHPVSALDMAGSLMLGAETEEEKEEWQAIRAMMTSPPH